MTMSGKVSVSLVFLSLVAARGASAAVMVLDASEEKKTYDCKGASAVVNGGDNVLAFRNCSRITINGGDNVIDAGIVEAIIVMGSGNKVMWTEGADGKRPAITNQGEGNAITSKPGPGGAGTGAKPPSAAKPASADKPASEEKTKSAPAAPKAGGSGSCATFSGHWELSGSCGPDECLVTQQGCTVDLKCKGGSISYKGTVSGSTFELAGKSGAGIDASCKGTISGKKLRGACSTHGVPTCKFTATVATE